MLPFEIKVAEVSEKYLVEIEGVDGPFLAGMIGSREELPGGRVYIDKDVQFFFYTKFVKGENGRYTADVYEATTERLKGHLPNIRGDVLHVVKENIILLLNTRSPAFPERPAERKEPLEKIIFSWGLK